MAWKAPERPIKRLLVVMPSWVGDCVMATPFLAAMRRIPAFADSYLAVYLRPGLEELLSGQPEIDEMIPGRPGGVLGPLAEGRRLAGQSFEAAVLLPNSWRLGFTVFVSRIPKRIGYGRDGRSWMLTDAVGSPVLGGWKQPFPAVSYYLHLAAYLGATGVESGIAPMHLACTEAQKVRAREILRAAAGIEEGEPIALLNPGGNNPAKRWPADRFASLGAWLATECGMRVLVNGSPPEAAFVHRICTEAAGLMGSEGGRVVSLTQYVKSLGDLKAICDVTRLVVTNDTGTRHIAAALGMARDSDRMHAGRQPGAGLVTIFGPTSPEWTTLGYAREIELYDRNTRDVGSITVADVQASCRRLLLGEEGEEEQTPRRSRGLTGFRPAPE